MQASFLLCSCALFCHTRVVVMHFSLIDTKNPPHCKINTHTLSHIHSHMQTLSFSPFSGSFASVLRPQGRLTFHSGSVSIPCDHSHAASPPLKVTVVVCQNPNKNTPRDALCVCVCVYETNK